MQRCGSWYSSQDKEVSWVNAVKERRVSLAGADWSVTAVQVALPSLRRGQPRNERNRLINQLARSMVTTLPLARGPSLRLLAVGLSVEELSYDFEARIGTGGFARED